MALVDDTKGMLREINNCAKLKANQTRVLNQLFEYINFHSDLKKSVELSFSLEIIFDYSNIFFRFEL